MTVAQSMTLDVYHGPMRIWVANEHEWCAATTAEDAAAAYEKRTGEPLIGATWTEEPATKVLTLVEDGERLSAQCHEWALCFAYAEHLMSAGEA